ncbi:hypothetical protein N0V83_005428 [Neocucurbitaria cava]|uniref:F-box domain-containing protein n=1 Tax=Neocucurbitaria cava TaxID=798079 RepID=A0A9W8Y7X0_9PLEO|nr:hypothetical protein N0V83_005428 [Neocucurbitaria cava]
MSPFVDFPAELLEEILELLSTADLSTLSRTCKELYTFFSPRVYHKIDWTWDDDKPCPPYHLLLRTLLSNARLASHIKVLRTRGGGIVPRSHWEEGICNDAAIDEHYKLCDIRRSVWVEGHRERSSFTSKDVRRVINLISSTAPTDAHRREWILEFYRGNVDVIMALILHQSQAIEELDLGFAFLDHAKFIPRAFKHLIDAQEAAAVYPHLASVNLGADGPGIPEWVWTDLDLFRLFIFLPNVKTIDAILLEPVLFAWPSPHKIPRADALSTLILRQCTISEDTLEAILSCTPKLKHLVYDYWRMAECFPPHWECCKDDKNNKSKKSYTQVPIHCPRLSKALAHVHTTLESLVLKAQFRGDMLSGPLSRDIKDPFESLCKCYIFGRVTGLDKMLSLKSLEASWALLFGWWDFPAPDYRGHPYDGVQGSGDNPWTSVLPPNIRRLCMRDDMSDFRDYELYSVLADPVPLFRHLLDARRKLFGSLEHVKFAFMYRHDKRDKLPVQIIRKLRDDCLRAGMACEIIGERIHSPSGKVIGIVPEL